MSKNRYRKAAIFLITVLSIVKWLQIRLEMRWETESLTDGGGTETSTRPTIIYHPGPPKVGTTSLQCALSRYQSKLLEDGYQFAGKVPAKFCPSVSSQSIQSLECLVSLQCQLQMQEDYQGGGVHLSLTELTQRMDELFMKRINVVLSDETHSMFHETDLYRNVPSLLFSNLFANWTKHLVVGYRWYWQFWLSSRHEYNRMFSSGPGRQQTRGWDGRQLQSITYMLREEVSTRSYLTPNTLSTIQFYQDYFDKVTILSMHDSKDMVENYICNILQAKSTCKDYSGWPRYNPSDTRSTASDLDQIAMSLKRWINTTRYSRWDVVNATLNMPNTPRTVMDCPSPTELHKLLRKSLQIEELLFQRRSRDLHVNNFWKANFCSVDLAATLKHDDWRIFFQSNFA